MFNNFFLNKKKNIVILDNNSLINITFLKKNIYFKNGLVFNFRNFFFFNFNKSINYYVESKKLTNLKHFLK